MENIQLVTCYTWNSNYTYIGEYTIQQLPGAPLVLPTNATLLPPPPNNSIEYELYWNGENWGRRSKAEVVFTPWG